MIISIFYPYRTSSGSSIFQIGFVVDFCTPGIHNLSSFKNSIFTYTSYLLIAHLHHLIKVAMLTKLRGFTQQSHWQVALNLEIKIVIHFLPNPQWQLNIEVKVRQSH